MANPKTPSGQPSPLSSRLERLGLALLGAALFCLPLVFWINTHDQFELPKLTVLRLLTAGLIGAWMARQALQPQRRLRLSPLDWPLLAWSAWLLVKTLHSVSPYISWRGEYENFAGSLTQLNYSLLLWLALQFARSEAAAQGLLLCYELSAVAVAGYAVFQALGLDFIVWSSTSVVTDRYFASMGNPNFLGAMMIMGLALVLGRAMARGSAALKPLLWQAAFLLAVPLAWLAAYLIYPPGHALPGKAVFAQSQKGALLVMGLYALGFAALLAALKLRRLGAARALALGLEALLLFKALADTGTRGAFAGLLATLGFFLLLLLRRRWRGLEAKGFGPARRTLALGGLLALFLGGLGLASLALGPELRRRMLETISHPLQAFDASRLNIWMPALHMAKDRPLTGFGVDTFKTVFPQYAYSRFAHYDGENVASRTAHCEPLQVLATMGLVGLALWFWLIGSWARAWWLMYRKEGEAMAPWRLGLAGLVLGYLIQNLVSFGVSAITAPFFIAMGLLWAGSELPERRLILPGPPKAWLALALAWLALSAAPATAAFRADRLYNFGLMVSAQNEAIDRAQLNDCANLARYAASELSAETLDAEQRREADFWMRALGEGEAAAQAGDPSALPVYRRGSKALLMLLSALRQERAAAMVPSEVKYRVYLGLAYEELYKLSSDAALRETWFARSEASYARGSAMNPRNAYYHGNLGRLYSLKSEEGQEGYAAKSEKSYLEAVALAPSTRLFYENLILLYAQNGMGQAGLNLLEGLQAREPGLAARLWASEGSTFFQTAGRQADKAKAKELEDAALTALKRAWALAPDDAELAYALGVVQFSQGRKAEARQALNAALRLNPAHAAARRFKTEKGL